MLTTVRFAFRTVPIVDEATILFHELALYLVCVRFGFFTSFNYALSCFFPFYAAGRDGLFMGFFLRMGG